MSLLPDDFTGNVRLFPLPNLVMFPHVVQPLHIFEPRYRAMMEEALATDRLIAMALLDLADDANPMLPDHDSSFLFSESSTHPPEIHPTVCVGKVLTHVERPDGTYDLLLAGVTRARVDAELDTSRPFRTAAVSVLRDQRMNAQQKDEESRLKRRIMATLGRFEDSESTEIKTLSSEDEGTGGGENIEPPGLGLASDLRKLLHGNVPLGILTDVVAFATDLPIPLKQRLLETTSVQRRAQLILSELETGQPSTEDEPSDFPPGFSDN